MDACWKSCSSPSAYTGAAWSCPGCFVWRSACSTWQRTLIRLLLTQISAPGKRLCHPKSRCGSVAHNPHLYKEPCGSGWWSPPQPLKLWVLAVPSSHRYECREKSGQSHTRGGNVHCSCGTCRCRGSWLGPWESAQLSHPRLGVGTRPVESPQLPAGSTTHLRCWRATARPGAKAAPTTCLWGKDTQCRISGVILHIYNVRLCWFYL